jgi:tRNA nucleotidyltransferase/poly(A) polymerase
MIKHVVEVLKKNNIKCIESGIKYGSVIAIIGAKSFDLTSLRTDVKCRGRHCDVESSSEYIEDAKRRDFTINAMYVSQKGDLFDYFHGEDDLKNRRVVFIGNPIDRIREDTLRILRYYRFCAYLRDYSHSYSRILQEVAHLVNNLSIERIQNELFRTIHSNIIINMMYHDGILQKFSESISINSFNRLKDIETTNIIRLCSLFPFEFVLNVLKLKRTQKQLISEYKKFLHESLEYCFYKKGEQFARDMAIIKLAKFNIPIDCNKNFKNIGKCPLSYQDLPQNLKNSSKILQKCEKWWANNKGINTKEECLNYAVNISNETDSILNN